MNRGQRDSETRSQSGGVKMSGESEKSWGRQTHYGYRYRDLLLDVLGSYPLCIKVDWLLGARLRRALPKFMNLPL